MLLHEVDQRGPVGSLLCSEFGRHELVDFVESMFTYWKATWTYLVLIKGALMRQSYRLILGLGLPTGRKRGPKH